MCEPFFEDELHQCNILLFSPRLVCLEIFLQTLHILVAKVGETSDIHIIRQIIDLSSEDPFL